MLLNSTLACAKCSEVGVLTVTTEKKKEQETLRKKSQTLYVWNHGVAHAKFIHDLGLS